MNLAVSFYKSLNFGRRVQIIRTLVLIQVLGFQLIWHFAANLPIRFYLEIWVGVSWFLVIALLLVEMVYEVKTYDD